ncbi:hypothetical protein [Sphingosinicella sp. CPCC 101087]|uniref:hypothetical protein n=1 Tax=Sphingosinicella sp. CPCC 101087 TaxID=2497754 RepID=UPI00101B671D|nr:hypothetical protein [Sphingosinicella sp. CPCC 101087]
MISGRAAGAARYRPFTISGLARLDRLPIEGEPQVIIAAPRLNQIPVALDPLLASMMRPAGIGGSTRSVLCRLLAERQQIHQSSFAA